MPKLDNNTTEILEEPISEEEVNSAIESMHPGKSPGPDGLTSAFYNRFKLEITPVLADVYNEAFELKILPPSFSSSHTVLIPKSEDPVELRRVTSYPPKLPH